MGKMVSDKKLYNQPEALKILARFEFRGACPTYAKGMVYAIPSLINTQT